MAYPPEHYLEHDKEKLKHLINRQPFAVLISAKKDIHVTQIPFLIGSQDNERMTLLGHMAANNPQALELEQQRVTLLFQGPHCYISPSIFKQVQVPSWNYATVHLEGRATLFREHDKLLSLLVAMTKTFEGVNPAYELDPQQSRVKRMLDLIVGIEVDVSNWIGRFKLSKEKPDQDLRMAKTRLLESTLESQSELIEALYA